MFQVENKLNKLALLLIATLSFALQGCLKDTCQRTVTYTQLVPEYVNLDEFRAVNPALEASRPIQNPGEIAYFDNKLYIGELGKGIHVFNNDDPQNPINTGFLAIPGNTNFCVHDNILYASNYIDLLAIDLGSQNGSTSDGFFQVVGRVENVFTPLWKDETNNQIAIGYVEKKQDAALECDAYGNFYTNQDGNLIEIIGLDNFQENPDQLVNKVSNDSSSSALISEPTDFNAQFTILNGSIYARNWKAVNILSLSNPLQPEPIGVFSVGAEFEALFSLQDKLVTAYNINSNLYDVSNPTTPVYFTSLPYSATCGAIFVKDNYAYISQSPNDNCFAANTQLNVVDINTWISNGIINAFPMSGPQGLTIANETLFLCEGMSGLKAFNISEPLQLDQHLLDHETGLNALDVIALDEAAKLLLVIAQDGFYQYNFDNSADLKLLSKISLN